MPTVTQSRSFVHKEPVGSGYEGASKRTVQFTTTYGAKSQTTTSFRGSKDKDYEGFTGEQIRAGFRNEYKTRYDSGNPFLTTNSRIEWDLSAFHAEWVSKASPRTISMYTGDILPVASSNQYPSSGAPLNAEVMANGRKLISMTIPTAPESGLAQLLGELKERLPSIVGSDMTRALQNRNGRGPTPGGAAGSEYLNIEFGWKPIARDIEKFARVAAQSSHLLRQYQRDSGRVVRRRAHLDQVRTVGTPVVEGVSLNNYRMTINNSLQNIFPQFLVTTGTGTGQSRLDITTTDTWFAGAYSYYLHGASTMLEKLSRYEQQANYLLGTRITPSLIYELTPWSWLLDWFGDLGTFFRNVSLLQSDSTVLRYGYVMHHSVATRTRTAYFRPNPSVEAKVNSNVATSRYVVETKQRHRATPYGFGLDVSSLSNKQWAILAALGLTKGDKALHTRL